MRSVEAFCPICGAPGPVKPGTWGSCPGCYALLVATGAPFVEKVSELTAHRQGCWATSATRRFLDDGNAAGGIGL